MLKSVLDGLQSWSVSASSESFFQGAGIYIVGGSGHVYVELVGRGKEGGKAFHFFLIFHMNYVRKTARLNHPCCGWE